MRLNTELNQQEEAILRRRNGRMSTNVRNAITMSEIVKNFVAIDLKKKDFFTAVDIQLLVKIGSKSSFEYIDNYYLLENKIKKEIESQYLDGKNPEREQELYDKIQKLNDIEKMVIYLFLIKINSNMFTELEEFSKEDALNYYEIYLQRIFLKKPDYTKILTEKKYDEIWEKVLHELELY